MRKLDGPLRTGGGTHTATLTYGFDNLRLLLAAEFHFRDGAEGAATDALAAGHTALVVHLRDLRVIFKFVAGKERQHLGRGGRAWDTDEGMSLVPWQTPARNTPAVLVSTGFSLGWLSMKKP